MLRCKGAGELSSFDNICSGASRYADIFYSTTLYRKLHIVFFPTLYGIAHCEQGTHRCSETSNMLFFDLASDLFLLICFYMTRQYSVKHWTTHWNSPRCSGAVLYRARCVNCSVTFVCVLLCLFFFKFQFIVVIIACARSTGAYMCVFFFSHTLPVPNLYMALCFVLVFCASSHDSFLLLND